MKLKAILLTPVGFSIFLYAVLYGSSAIAGSYSCEAEIVNARIKILLLRYGGTKQGKAINQYSNFITAITNRLNSIGPAMQNFVTDEPEAFMYLDDLEVEPQDTDPTLSASGRHIYWEKTGSLELLRGNLLPGSPHFSVQSHIFIGDLRGRYPHKEVVVKLPLLDEKGPPMLDSHSVVTLYALAMDASAFDCDWLKWRLLEAAFSALMDLKNQEDGLKGDLIELEQAINCEMAQIQKALSPKCKKGNK